MPPKPAAKKGKEDELDFSDVPTLPPLNSINFTLLYHKFFSTETREKISKHVLDKLPADRIKTLTREEAIIYGKAKQFIFEPSFLSTLPQDEPRQKWTEADQIAKAVTEKLFEYSVYARRTKKEKILKLEEEAKLLQQPDQNNNNNGSLLDKDLIDIMFQLVDFPANKAEALAFSKLGQSLNCVFEINQSLKIAEYEDEQDELQNQESQADLTQIEIDHRDKIFKKINSLQDARSSSVKQSKLRHLSFQQATYINWPTITIKTNDQGEEIEEKKDPESFFTVELISNKLEKLGALYIKYLRFKDKVALLPLVPDKQAMQEIVEIKNQQAQYQQWFQDGLASDSMDTSMRDKMDPIQLQEYQQWQLERKQEFENQKNDRAKEEEDRKQRLEELNLKMKLSVDDIKDYSSFNIKAYEDGFIPHKETQNSIQSVMSSMVTQLAQGEENFQMNQTQEVQLSDYDQFNQIMADLEKSVGKIGGYGNWQQQDDDDDNFAQQNESTVSNRQRKQGMQALSKQNTVVGEVEYNEEQDKSRQAIYRLPKDITNQDVDKAEDIGLIQNAILSNLVVPGFNRHLMPSVPSKSKRIRDAEKASLYPFCTLPVEDSERALILKTFQDMIRSNFIDEGQSTLEKHAKYKSFERHFQNHMKSDILKQEIATALLQEPDISTLYYPRDDSLLLALYNKVKVNRKDDYDFDGERDWRAAYRVMPDFENFLIYFADEICIPSVIPVTKEFIAHKYQLDEEMIPDKLLEIDDSKISNISEKSSLFFPGDNSVMRVDSFCVGGIQQNPSKSKVIKDNMSFGLRQSVPTMPQTEEEKEYGLISFKSIGETEFWLNFEDDTKILVELIQKTRNPQKLIRIDPPKPTPEEIAAREEQVKQAQLAASKLKGKAAKDAPVIEEYKEPEPTWEPEPLNFLDNQYSDSDLNEVYYQTTSTFQNGLIVKHLCDGNIIQLRDDQINSNSEEIDRIILFDSGAVIRHLRNKDAEILYPTGVTAYFHRKDMMWIITNSKGFRRAKKDGIEWDVEPMLCAHETDAVTNAKMMIREDKTMTIQFIDGSLYCQHADGTMMHTIGSRENYNLKVRIEKEGYATIVRNIEEDSYKDQSDSFKIAWNRVSYYCNQKEDEGVDYEKKVVETFMPDGTVVQTFSTDSSSGGGAMHIFNRPDFTVVSVDPTGNIAIISSNSRSAMNEQMGKKIMGKDTDYELSLFNDPSCNRKGIYYVAMNPIKQDSYIQTMDMEGQYLYQLTGDHKLQKCQNDYFPQSADGYQQKVNSARDNQIVQINGNNDDGRELEDVGYYKSPLTKHFVFPRLFVIHEDGNGYELLAKEQLDYYFRVMKNIGESIKQREVNMVGNTSIKSHYFIQKIINLTERESQQIKLNSLNFPQNAEYALISNRKKHSQPQVQKCTQPDQYLFRQIFEFQEFEAFKQDAFYDDFQRYIQWKVSQVRYNSEFGITWVPLKDQQLDYKKIEDDEYYSKRIITKILKERRSLRKKFLPEEFKAEFLLKMKDNEEINDFMVKLTLNDKSDWRSITSSNQVQTIEKIDPNHQAIEGAQFEQWKQKKKISSQQKVQTVLDEIHRMINTPAFLTNYFKGQDGQAFIKNNPQIPPSKELMIRMSQRINRTNQNSDKAQSHYDGYSQKSANSPDKEGQQQPLDEKDNPIVALEPEDQLKQGSAFMGSKTKNQTNNPLANASLYLQERVYVKQKEQEHLLKSEEYHVVKTKDFNVIGRLRQDKPFVKSIQKSNAQSDLNEKFITTECIADRRVKISSMAPRQYISAPSVEDVRKQGQHQMILSAINKKQTFAELINQANSMVTGVLHDPLKRSINIMPSKLVFGQLKAGDGSSVHQITLTIKNEDSIALRVTIKPLEDRRIQVQQVETGPIAPGITRKIIVTIKTTSEDQGLIKDTLQIMTKTDIFKIPIEATILNSEAHDEAVREQIALGGKGVVNSRVREKLNSSISKGRWKNMINQGEPGMEQEGDFENSQDGLEEPPAKQWILTTGSDSRLPKIPTADKRPFEVDPKKNLKELLKK